MISTKESNVLDRVVLAGSALPHMRTARVVGAPDPASTVQLLVVMRADPAGPQPRTLEEHSRLSFADRRCAGPRRLSAAQGDLVELHAWAGRHGLRETASRLGGRAVTLEGTIRQAEEALALTTALVEDDGEVVLGFHGDQTLPGPLAEAVIGMLGLDGRHSRRPVARAGAAAVSYTPPQVASMYSFPATHGSGQSIAIIELGGGYVASDLDTYFTQTLGLPSAPTINAITVSGPGNSPGSSADGEVCLDIEVSAGIAYEATINVYFGAGFCGQVACISQAIDDGNAVITSSWGSNWESSFSDAQRNALDTVLQAAADANVTVLHGANDRGSWGTKSSEPTPDNCDPHASYPPTSPWITATGDDHPEGSSFWRAS